MRRLIQLAVIKKLMMVNRNHQPILCQNIKIIKAINHRTKEGERKTKDTNRVLDR